MCGTSEGVLVRLHNIKFWAHVTANIGAITVLERVTIICRCGHDNGIEGSQAATSAFVEVDVELDRTAK